MFLTVGERLSLLQILPTKGDFVTLKVLTQLRLNLGLSDKEITEWEVVLNSENNQVSWGVNGEAEIPIGEVATGLIVDVFRGLDRKKELSVNLMDLYETFIPTTE